MVWVPGVDEIPLSLSTICQDGLSSVTVKVVGECTKSLFEMESGASFSIRGPYGNSFELVKGTVALVGGGTGLAPLLPLVKALVKLESVVTLIIAGKSKEDILFQKEIEELVPKTDHKLIIATEDGTHGIKGTAMDAFNELMENEPFDMVYTCGPEPMMINLFELCDTRDIRIQVCLERIIRCSIGLCGSCTIGPFRVCKDGLVLSSKKLREVIDEFGKFKRDFNGRKICL
jgi:dihydroorotate dehydrogenase electron transfer subunit